jgi:hypothetical protein
MLGRQFNYSNEKWCLNRTRKVSSRAALGPVLENFFWSKFSLSFCKSDLLLGFLFVELKLIVKRRKQTCRKYHPWVIQFIHKCLIWFTPDGGHFLLVERSVLTIVCLWFEGFVKVSFFSAFRYVCHECQKAYQLRQDLKLHMRKHTG